MELETDTLLQNYTNNGNLGILCIYGKDELPLIRYNKKLLKLNHQKMSSILCHLYLTKKGMTLLSSAQGIDSNFSKFNDIQTKINEMASYHHIFYCWKQTRVNPTGKGSHVFMSYLEYRGVCVKQTSLNR
jgi:hypothetical protein